MAQGWYKSAQNSEKGRKLIICRGCPGSGKSTLAKQLAGETGQIFSTDEFFMKDGKYNFNSQLLGRAHNWNQARAEKAMQDGVTPIIIDNTNVKGRDARSYVENGLKYGYDIKFQEPDTPWKFDAEELAKRNQHGVPLESIERMIKNWEPDLTVDKIIDRTPGLKPKVEEVIEKR